MSNEGDTLNEILLRDSRSLVEQQKWRNFSSSTWLRQPLLAVECRVGLNIPVGQTLNFLRDAWPCIRIEILCISYFDSSHFTVSDKTCRVVTNPELGDKLGIVAVPFSVPDSLCTSAICEQFRIEHAGKFIHQEL